MANFSRVVLTLCTTLDVDLKTTGFPKWKNDSL